MSYKIQDYRPYTQDTVMTVTKQGVMLKLGSAVMFALAAAGLATIFFNIILYVAAIIAGLVLIWKTSKNPESGNNLLIPFSVAEGYVLGGFTILISEIYGTGYGLALFASLIVSSIFAGNLFAYTIGLLQPNATFINIIKSLTLAALVFYLAAIATGLFGETTLIDFYSSSSFLSLGLSLLMVGVAASNITVDFMVLRQQENNAPKEHEAFLAMLMLSSLVWTYMEVLRFLAKFANRD